MRIIIRKFKEEDAKDLVKIDLVWKNERVSLGMSSRTAKEFIKDYKKAICLVAELNNKIVGYAFGGKKVYKKKKKLFYLNKGEKYVNFDSLYVLKPYRKFGIGKKLIQTLIKESKKQGFDSIHLVADSKEQEKLVSLYRTCGFEFVFTKMKLNLK